MHSQTRKIKNIFFILKQKPKKNLHYTRRITPKRVTSCGAHLRGLAPEQHSSKETWRHCVDLTSPGIKPQTSRTDSVRLATELTAGLSLYSTLDIRLKRVTSGGALLRGLAPEQHSSEETSQRWRVFGDPVSDLTGWEPNQRPPAPATTPTGRLGDNINFCIMLTSIAISKPRMAITKISQDNSYFQFDFALMNQLEVSASPNNQSTIIVT